MLVRKKADRKTKFYLVLIIAEVVAEITIIIGLCIFLFLIIRNFF